jgi:AcrR family transcriptional regulator
VEPAPDGRRQRADRSRDAIVQALLDLVEKAVLQPTAQQVAESAGVGIRTVFRHFSDMESLYAAMDARVQHDALPLLRVRPATGRLEARVRALAQIRIDFFERIAPYHRAGAVQRGRSPFLQGRHRLLVRKLRADLLRWLPELRGASPELLEAFDLALSLETWERLRMDQRLGCDRARAVLETLLLPLTTSLGR